MNPRDAAGYAFLALAWGLSFALVLRVEAAFGLVGAVAFRALVAAASLLAASAMLGCMPRLRRGWGRFAVVGATTVAGQLLGLSYGAPRIGTAMTAILVATIPLFSMAIGWAWGIERPSRATAAGLALGVGGIVLLVGFPAVEPGEGFALGCAAALAGSACAAFGSCYASRALRDADPRDISTGAFLAGGAMTLPLLVLVPVPAMPDAGDVAALVVLGGVMSALTYVVYFGLVASIGATRAISVEFAVPVVAAAFGWAFLGERLAMAQVAGALAIAAGCALALGLLAPGSKQAADRG